MSPKPCSFVLKSNIARCNPFLINKCISKSEKISTFSSVIFTVAPHDSLRSYNETDQVQ